MPECELQGGIMNPEIRERCHVVCFANIGGVRVT